MGLQVVGINGITADFGSEVLRDSTGNTVALRPQTFAVLRHLVGNANRLVTKDELMQAVWPGIAVTDDSLVQCIHEIRRALGDESQTVLKTVPRRGYRMVLPEANTVVSAAPTGTALGNRRLAVAAVAAAALVLVAFAAWRFLQGAQAPIAIPAIAVLPFDNLGGDPAQAYVADGISQDLITDLSGISGLSVAARDSAWVFRDNPADLRTVARELGVQYVLDGSVQWQGDKVRVNAQLIDAAAGRQLWAERYDGPLEDIFAFHFQDKVIARIVSALAVKLTPEEVAQSRREAGTDLATYGTPPLGLHPGDALVIQAKISKAGDWLEFGFDSAWMIVGTKLARVNAADNSLVEIDIKASGNIRPIVAGEGAVWVQDINKRVIIKVDPVANQVVQEIPAQMLYHQSALGTGDGSIWAVTASGGFDKMLTRFNAATGEVEAEIPLPSIGGDVLVDFDSVWVAGIDGNAVYRIDPKANAIVATIPVHTRPKKLCALEGSVWVLNSTDGFVDRIDGRTGQITASINAGLVFPADGDFDCGGGYVWGHVAAWHASDKAIPSLPLVQIDPKTNEVIRRYIGGKGFGWSLQYGAGSLWMTGSSLFRIEPPA
jgi:virginiamycin B lyase